MEFLIPAFMLTLRIINPCEWVHQNFMCVISKVDHTMSLIMFLSLASHNLTPFSLSPSNMKHLMRSFLVIPSFIEWKNHTYKFKINLSIISFVFYTCSLWTIMITFSHSSLSSIISSTILAISRLSTRKSCELYVTVSICKTPNSTPVSVAI